jgi:hypothetical protein
METHGHKIYGFWDGDFTFHMQEYDHDPSLNGMFRVRIDNESPEERAIQNRGNLNAGAGGWTSIRPCTEEEAARWLHYFAGPYPLRPASSTAALRHLRLHGFVEEAALSGALRGAVFALADARTVVRDFVPTQMRLAERVGTRFQLTDDGLWLTSLMK